MDNEADKDHDVCKRPTNRSAADKELMKLFNKPSGERDITKLKKAIPFMKKIKFFSQRQIEDEEYLEIMRAMKHIY